MAKIAILSRECRNSATGCDLTAPDEGRQVAAMKDKREVVKIHHCPEVSCSSTQPSVTILFDKKLPSAAGSSVYKYPKITGSSC